MVYIPNQIFVSLNSRLESNKEEEEDAKPNPQTGRSNLRGDIRCADSRCMVSILNPHSKQGDRIIVGTADAQIVVVPATAGPDLAGVFPVTLTAESHIQTLVICKLSSRKFITQNDLY